jgi:uncharacterized membrane protein
MNSAYLHLIVNHIPVIGLPLALAFFFFSVRTKNEPSRRFSLWVLTGVAAMALPAYLSGDGAESLVEHLPGVKEAFISAHEESAEISLILSLLAGATAFVALWFSKSPALVRRLNLAVLTTSIIASLSLIYTANLGGMVRHTELRADPDVIEAPSDLEDFDNLDEEESPE